MITPSFALTATERVLPSLALDFTTASLDSRVTFTRSGATATAVNSSGLVASFGTNTPRFDYDPVALTCKGLLIEEARTNLVIYSEDFTNAEWTKNGANVNVTANQAVSPDGLTTADLLFESTTATAERFVSSANKTILATSVCAGSIYVKAAGRGFCQLRLGNGNGTFSILYVTVNLSTGAVVNSGAIGGALTSTLISNAGNGYWRISIVGTFAIDVTLAILSIYLSDGSSTNYVGVPSNGIYIWGAQLEVGSFATSYIPTVASQVTRTADVAVMTSTNFSNWYTATTGAAVVWAIPQTATGTRPLVQFDDTTALKIITLRGNVADPELYIVDTLAQAQIDAGTIVANTAYKLSGGWDTNNCAAAKDGGTVGTDVVATIPAPTQLRIGSDGTNYACAWVQKVMYWKQRIINAEVQAFSK